MGRAKVHQSPYRALYFPQALDQLCGVLAHDRSDEEIVGYALDTLANICSPDSFDEEEDPESRPNSVQPDKQNFGIEFSEMFLKVNLLTLSCHILPKKKGTDTIEKLSY